MKVTRDFETEEERKTIIVEMTTLGYTLVEAQNHFDGNHLIFETNEPLRDLATELDALKARVEVLEIVKVK